MKTVTEIRWSSTHDTFILIIAESAYFVLNSLLDWEPVERLNFCFQYEDAAVLYAAKVMERGSRLARKDITVVVEV